MKPLYDRHGSVVGWIRQGRILDRDNRYRAFLRGDAVYSMSGQYLGRFRRGFFRDKSGGAVAFIRGASGGPMTPIPSVPPIPAIPPIPPINPIPSVPPVASMDSLRWGEEWESFLGA